MPVVSEDFANQTLKKRNIWLRLGYNSGDFLARYLPLSWSRFLAVTFSAFAWHKPIATRQVICDNLQKIFPEKTAAECANIGKKAFANFAVSIAEFLALVGTDAQRFWRYVEISGVELALAELEKKKGLIFLSMHLGNWEIGAAALAAALPVDTYGIAMESDDSEVAKFFAQRRQNAGVCSLKLTDSLAALKILKKGQALLLLGDRDPTAAGIELPFFHHLCRFPQGPARLALTSGAPVLPVELRRQKGKLQVTIMPAVAAPELLNQPENKKAQAKAARTIAYMQKFVHLFEIWLQQSPEDWVAFQPLVDKLEVSK